MHTGRIPNRDTIVSRREVNGFRAVRLDLVRCGRRCFIRLGFEGRAKGSAIWTILNTYAVLDPGDVDWLQRELSRAGAIAATSSTE